MKTVHQVILLSYLSIASASAAILTPALPAISESMKLSNSSLQWIVSIFLVGYLLGQWLYGPIANRYGRLSALRMGFILNLVGILISGISGVADNYYGLLFGRWITALGASAGLVCTFILINEYFESAKAKYLISFVVLSFTLGIGLAILLGGMITTHLRWEDCFVLLFLHGVFALASTWMFKETLITPLKISVSQIISSYGVAVKNRTLFAYASFVGWVSLFSYGYSTVAPNITHEWFSLSAASYGYWSILNMVGMFLGALLAIKLLKRYASSKIIIFALVSMLGILGLIEILKLMQWLNVFEFFVLSALLYAFASLIFPAASHIASTAIADKASASGAMNGINLGIAVIGLILIGFLPFNWFVNLILVMIGFAGLSAWLKFISEKVSKNA